MALNPSLAATTPSARVGAQVEDAIRGYLLLGQAYESLQNYDKAARAYEEAVDLTAENGRYRVLAANAGWLRWHWALYGLQRFSNAEIQDFYLARGCDLDICGFQIAVNDSPGMGGAEGLRNLDEHSNGFLGGDWAPCDSLREGFAFD